MFYQPWVGGAVPGVGAVMFSADDLANGRARTVADNASAPPPRVPSGAAPGAPATGGAPSLPTRVPTFAPGAVAPTTMPSAAERTVAAGNATPTPMAAGGMTLPTRVPTFAPGAVAPTTMPSAAERTALATPGAVGNAPGRSRHCSLHGNPLQAQQLPGHNLLEVVDTPSRPHWHVLHLERHLNHLWRARAKQPHGPRRSKRPPLGCVGKPRGVRSRNRRRRRLLGTPAGKKVIGPIA